MAYHSRYAIQQYQQDEWPERWLLNQKRDLTHSLLIRLQIVNMHSNEGSNTAHCLGEYMKIIQVSLGKRTHWEEVLKR